MVVSFSGSINLKNNNLLTQAIELSFDIGVKKKRYFKPEAKSKGFKTIAGAGGQKFRRTSRKPIKNQQLNIPFLLAKNGYDIIITPLKKELSNIIKAVDVINAFYKQDKQSNKRIENLIKGVIRQFMLNNNYKLKQATIKNKGFKQASVDTGQTLQNIIVQRRG